MEKGKERSGLGTVNFELHALQKLGYISVQTERQNDANVSKFKSLR